jgi:antitoxin FitA
MIPKWNCEETMVTITVKNMPEQIYERIKMQAKANRRSVNSEIVFILEQAFPKRTSIEVNEILERARKARELTANHTITANEIEKMINEGRE